MRRGSIRRLLATALAASLAPAFVGFGARAAFTAVYSQDGADVVARGHGTIDLDALTFVETSSGYTTAQVVPSIGIALGGAAPAHEPSTSIKAWPALLAERESPA